jgi:hypothetical protein
VGEQSSRVRRADEPRRFVSYYDSMASATSVELAKAIVAVP